MPAPRAGHFALSRCERVTMLVLGAAAEPIPLPLRRDWMRERHPRARVIAGWDELPIDFDDPHVHDVHIAVMQRLLNEPIDAVFTGEAYGDLLAARWGVEHVCQPRAARSPAPRSAPTRRAWWSQLTPAVRAYLCRRVVITGAESTGTTTLARALAARLRTAWVPEVGRAVTEARGLPYVLDRRRLRRDRSPPAARRGSRGARQRPAARVRHRRARHLHLAGALHGPLDRTGRADRGESLVRAVRAHKRRHPVRAGRPARRRAPAPPGSPQRFRERLRAPLDRGARKRRGARRAVLTALSSTA